MSGLPPNPHFQYPNSASPGVAQMEEGSSSMDSSGTMNSGIPSSGSHLSPSSFLPAAARGSTQPTNIFQSPPPIHTTGQSFMVRWPPSNGATTTNNTGSPSLHSPLTGPRPVGRPPMFTGTPGSMATGYSSGSTTPYSSATSTPSFRARGRGRGRPPLHSYTPSTRPSSIISSHPGSSFPATPQSSSVHITSSTAMASATMKPNELSTQASTTPTSSTRDLSRMDLESLQDVTTYADIDLKEESEHILKELPGVAADQFDFAYDLIEGRRDAFLHLKRLKRKLQDISLGFGIDSVQEEMLDCLTLAAQEYLRAILEELILVSKHREEVTYDKLSITTTRDPKKQLWLLDRQDRELKRRDGESKPQEEEIPKQEEEIEERNVAAASDKGVALSATQLKKKRKERDDAVSKAQAANVAALAALGVAKKSWMTIDMNRFVPPRPGSISNGSSEKKPPRPTGAPTTLQRLSSSTVTVDARQISMKDVLFYMERDLHSRKSRRIYESYLRLK